MVRPISGQNNAQGNSQPIIQQNKKDDIIKIGGVIFKKNQVESKTSFVENGKKMNTVFVKGGTKIEFPDQTNKEKNPSVEYFAHPEWNDACRNDIEITDIENATIYGHKNKKDYIELKGKASGNKIIVDKQEGLLYDKSVRGDQIQLDWGTENNTVVLDEADKLKIWHYENPKYNKQTGLITNVESVDVEGPGVSEQEAQLKDALTSAEYNLHKNIQAKGPDFVE